MNSKKLWIATLLVAIVIAFATLSPAKHVIFDPMSKLPDGAIYRGEYENGVFHGEGSLKWGNGDEYSGEFREGLMHGEGAFVWPNGEKYIGEFSEGLMHGTGEMFIRSGDVYRGEFSAGYFSGRGEYTASNGNSYSGEFANGAFHGVGDYKMRGGDTYSGEFSEGSMHGKGRYVTPDGSVYDGDFVEDEFTGTGSLSYGNGSKYTGGFNNWEFEGEGEFVTGDGEIYKGFFERGEMVGKGTHITGEGDKYFGEFSSWTYNGKGELTKKSGERYIGEFQYGQMHGQGTLTTVDQDGKKITKSGEWSYGSFLEDEKREREQRELRVEKALYSQKQTLDEHLARLRASDVGVIDLYFLGVAGYGKQEVFRKEVAFINDQFTSRFGIEGRSVQLINSKESSSQYPLATVTSVKSAIKEMESRMNVDEDILFVYMTSHGSDKDGLVLSYDGMSLPDISPQELAGVLDRSAIKYRVVMVSACYSGTFIKPLKNEYTLIITAADKDRKSFGCSDDNDITDFAKAYFVEALPGSATFEEAFGKARAIIDQEEKSREIKQHSAPQFVMGSAIRQQLVRWREQSGY